MTQEVINNMVKHSKAKQIDISLRTTDKLFILACKDDGVGFDLEEKSNSAGAGLKNLKSRALLINANLYIQSVPGSGSQVTIELPL
jgi:signal transduction histidine kinase